MSVDTIIKYLKAAWACRERHPGLMLGYAIGLTAMDRGVAERYAALLQHHNVFEGGPPVGGEISEQDYEAIREHYKSVDAELVRVLGFRPLNLAHHEVFSEMIKRLEQLSA